MAARWLACRIRSISSRRLAPSSAANWVPVWRRSWKCAACTQKVASALIHTLPKEKAEHATPSARRTQPSFPRLAYSGQVLFSSSNKSPRTPLSTDPLPLHRTHVHRLPHSREQPSPQSTLHLPPLPTLVHPRKSRARTRAPQLSASNAESDD